MLAWGLALVVVSSVPTVLAEPHAHVHVYGKAPRPGRKVGHVTVTADDAAELDARLPALRAAIGA